ncbi:hypothetical protein [Carboxylicivirga marina]|uniref:Uncharacterized protein n=1 Tax=Carboxylicivirga marina TaxID=2800988 RepID=A0ABS1HKA2_9BACT|nr:hypothetical protein [Carboxylicivirga marina]MBK3518030.1 hypothetical protein [Carboxylicivirga marina]
MNGGHVNSIGLLATSIDAAKGIISQLFLMNNASFTWIHEPFYMMWVLMWRKPRSPDIINDQNYRMFRIKKRIPEPNLHMNEPKRFIVDGKRRSCQSDWFIDVVCMLSDQLKHR